MGAEGPKDKFIRNWGGANAFISRTQGSCLNYRHAFHAGNFADVVKHVALALCLERLNAKPAPYRYIDTHAGIGRYDLHSEEAERSPEWKDGVGRVCNVSSAMPAAVQAALAPWLRVLDGMNTGVLQCYPGSPLIAQRMMRLADALRFCELHQGSSDLLAQAIGPDRRVKIEQRDGFEALIAFLPPPERRGLVLIDPPFEAGTSVSKSDFDRMLSAARSAIRRWPQGTYIFWRPLKDLRQVARFDSELASLLIDDGGLPPEKVIVVDLWTRAIGEGKLSGAGVVIVNPPFGIESHLRMALPWLSEVMRQSDGAGWRLESPSQAGQQL